MKTENSSVFGEFFMTYSWRIPLRDATPTLIPNYPPSHIIVGDCRVKWTMILPPSKTRGFRKIPINKRESGELKMVWSKLPCRCCHTPLIPPLQISHETWVALNWIGFVLGCYTILPRCCIALDVIVVRMKFWFPGLRLQNRAALPTEGPFTKVEPA